MPMTDIIVEHLKNIKRTQEENQLLQINDYINSDYVFTHVTGDIIKPNYITKRFRKLLIKNNLDIICFHDLRHSSASYLLYLGFNLKEIQAWLGHSSISTTMNIYAHLDISIKHNMANELSQKFNSFNTK